MGQNGHPGITPRDTDPLLEIPVTALRASLTRSASRPLPTEQLQNLALVQLTLVVLALVALALQAS